MPEVWFQMVKPTVISTFAGCGGSSLGYKLAGFRELLAVEWDDNAVETFKLNFLDVPVYHGDIARLSGAECMKLAGIKAGELDVLDGSPPCQGFSTAGKRKFDDPRNSLFNEFARLVKELQPRVFVMENVTGMVKGCMKQAYLVIIKTLRDCGYRAKGEVMNAMYFNVPQSRERVIIIGVRNDLGIEPTHPKPQGKPVMIREAFRGCEDSNPCYLKSGEVARIIKNMRQGEDGSEASKRLTGNKNKWFNMRRLDWNKTGFTITRSEGSSALVHPELDRVLNISEYKRVASYPDGFMFSGKYTEQKSRIGNSVPPNLMRAIAEHIKEKYLNEK